MEKALIKKENDFLELWEDEIRKRKSSLLENKIFPENSKILIKNILDASKSVGGHITSEDFLAVAKVLQTIIFLQENQISNEDIVYYLDSLFEVTNKIFPNKQSEEISKFKKVLEHLLTYTRNQYSTELLLKEEISYLEHKIDANILSMVGSSRTINKLIKEINPILDNDVTVLIEGETGTGKELMARAIYNNSHFKNGPFIALNCAAIPEDLMESEMFGYKKGAFTDAVADKPGKLELANNGILFLDEINELSLKLQAKLLRIIQERVVTRIGEIKERKIQIKIICTTNKNLKTLMEEGKIREDFYYRINVYKILLPPIRERVEDISPLANYYLAMRSKEFNKPFTGFSPEAINLMQSYNWPGNIREIDNVVTRAVLKSYGKIVEVKDLDIYLTIVEKEAGHQLLANDKAGNLSLREVEKEHIKYVLHKNKNNMVKSSKELGITRTTLYNKLKEYTINNA